MSVVTAWWSDVYQMLLMRRVDIEVSIQPIASEYLLPCLLKLLYVVELKLYFTCVQFPTDNTVLLYDWFSVILQVLKFACIHFFLFSLRYWASVTYVLCINFHWNVLEWSFFLHPEIHVLVFLLVITVCFTNDDIYEMLLLSERSFLSWLLVIIYCKEVCKRLLHYIHTWVM